MFAATKKDMIWFCTSLGTMLDAGMPVSRALEVLSGQAPAGRVGRAIDRMRREIGEGATLAEAMENQGIFPELAVDLVSVGEQSGQLDRTLDELAQYYEFQREVRNDFLTRIALPVVEYVVAVAVIVVAGYLIDVLSGREGSMLPGFMVGYGIPVALILGYFFLLKPLGGTRAVDEVVLRMPVMGNVARSLALARFSLVMNLLIEAAVPMPTAVGKAARATGNGAFMARAERAGSRIEQGSTLTEGLERMGLFPLEYVQIVEIAEESGKLTERFQWLSDHHAERSRNAMRALAVALAWVIWAVVAAFIVYNIFIIFSQYVGGLQRVM